MGRENDLPCEIGVTSIDPSKNMKVIPADGALSNCQKIYLFII